VSRIWPNAKIIKHFALWTAIVLPWVVGPSLRAQDYLVSTGTPSFAVPYPVEMGLVDAASGNLHLEFPLGSYPQRGGSTLNLKLAYDSHIWTTGTDGVSTVWYVGSSPGQGSFNGGWRLVDPRWPGWLTVESAETPNCTFDQEFWSPNGTQHWFHVVLGTGTWGSGCSSSTFDAYASDSSGLQLQVTCVAACGSPTYSLYAPDGTRLYTNGNSTCGPEDSNGNCIQVGFDGTDTLGRVPLTVSTTSGCEFESTVIPSTGSNPFYECFELLSAQGTAVQYTLTWKDIPVKSNFQYPDITDCTTQDWCYTTVIASIALPDGSSYSFGYDCYEAGNVACISPEGQSAYYGALTKMTLPTGETVGYTYENFQDAQGWPNRWLTQKASSAGTWSFSPLVTNSGAWSTSYPCASGSSVAGCRQVTVIKPDNSEDVETFAINNGAWATTIQHYDTDHATILATVTNKWDFSNPCALFACGGSGAQDVRKLITYTTLPMPNSGNITKATLYTYDTPSTANVTEIQEWRYQNGPASNVSFPSVADRTTYITYATIGTNNNINRPATRVICNNVGTGDPNCPGGGTTVAHTVITYDNYGNSGSAALASVTGAANHDDTNYGTNNKARGNPTQIARWVSGTTYLTTALSYDTTGGITKIVDPNNNPTTISHADSFYDDNGSDPPAAHNGAPFTNAFVTQVTDNVGSVSLSYYYGTGQLALTSDYNGATTYAHYVDPFSRPTKTDYPIGWSLHSYTSATQLDSYSPVADTAASTSCVSCTHTQALLDALGRVTTANLVNNLPQQSSVEMAYDGLNRVLSASHPNFGSTDPNDVLEQTIYDGVGRALRGAHPDGQSFNEAYGANVGLLAGLTTQQSSVTTYGYGFPVVSLDEAGKQGEHWIDGFGKTIEVDESSQSGSPATGSVTISGSDHQVYQCPPGCKAKSCCSLVWDNGTVSITVAGYTVSASYYDGTTDQSIATTLAAALNSPHSPVSATASGSTVNILANGSGTATDYSLSATSTSEVTGGTGSYTTTASGSTLTGGSGGIDSSPWVTTYNYDALGNLTSITQGSESRSWQYDGLSRLVKQVTPEAGTVTLSYVSSSGALCSGNPSNVCSRTDARGITTTYSYDTANRLTQIAHSDTTGTFTYAHDAGSYAKGRLSSFTDPSGSETYTYDQMGRIKTLAKVIGGVTYTISYQYNTGGLLTQLTYPSGRNVYYNYDNVGHLCVVDVAADTNCTPSSTPYLTIQSASYDASSRPLSATYGNGIVGSATYSPQRFELTSVSYVKGSTTLFGLNYYYQQTATQCPSGNSVGNNGQIQCATDVSAGAAGASGRSISYNYDQLGRLLTATTAGSTQYPAWGLSETYDRYGNRTNQTVTAGSGPSFSNAVNTNNRLVGYTYDASGNLIGYPSNAATFAYNGEECNTTFGGGGDNATYTCDANHIRVMKSVTGTGAVTTVYIYSGGRVIAEYDNGAAVNSPSREYIYGHKQLATISGSVGGSGGTIQYMLRDHVSPRVFTDVNGNDVAEQGTYPFGEQLYKNSSTSAWVYSSYERDQESGLDYTIARSYSSSLARFLAPDPVRGNIYNPQRLNRYTYVLNDPTNKVDPSGGDDDDDDDDDDSGSQPPGGGVDLSWAGLGTGDSFLGAPSSGQTDDLPDAPSSLACVPNCGGNQWTTPIVGDSGPVDAQATLSFSAQAQQASSGGSAAASSSALDIAQGVLSVAGFIPVIGDFANLANAGISAYRGNWGQAALFAFSAIPVVGELGEIGQAAEIAEEVEQGSQFVSEADQLAERATEIHDVLDPIAQDYRTTAVLSTEEGVTVVGGGVRDLTAAQQQALADGEVGVALPGEHAEVTVLTAATESGLTPNAIGVSRPICPACQAEIEASGGTLTGSKTAVW
jgi:RHS repeat-associated protein